MALVVISLFVNVEIFFEFSVHRNNLNSLFSYETGDYPFYSTSIHYLADLKVPYGPDSNMPAILIALRYIRVLIVDVAYVIVSFIVDLKLYLFVREQMRKKAAITHENEHIEVPVIPAGTVSDRIKRRRQEIKHRKKDIILKNRITGIIILNGVNFFLFRLPTALLSSTLLFFSFDSESVAFKPSRFAYKFCIVFRFCDLLREITLLFYFFSFFMQFFIMFKLDKNLKEAIRKIFNKS